MRRRRHGASIVYRLSTLFVVVCLFPAAASAQNASHWGVVVSFAPEHSWKVIPKMTEFLFDPGEHVDVRSTDFRIGIARGRDLGGDWGVSYVRRNIADGSRFENTTEICTGNTQCVTALSEFALTRGVTQIGVEVHKFIPFVTIKRRAQIGLNVAGGVSKFEGSVEFHEFDTDFTFDPRTGQVTNRRVESVSSRPMSDIPTFSPFPFGRVEAAVAVILAPGVKIRGSGGFDFPGYTMFSITGVFLFGAR
jgi:hypothetical protein